MEEEPIIDALKRATGWDDISALPTSYVIRFSIYDRQVIKGLRRDKDTFYLELDDFDDVPLSFLVEDPNTGATLQYWTLQRRLHRTNGPAFVAWKPAEGIMERCFYYFGLEHNPNGPSKETYEGYTIDTDTFANHVYESWDRAGFSWKMQGQFQHNYGRWGVSQNGSCYRYRGDRSFDAPDDFGPTLRMDKLLLEWSDFLYDPNVKKEGVVPQKLEFINLEEDYKRGEFVRRTCDDLRGSWLHNGKLFSWMDEGDRSAGNYWVQKFTQKVHKNLLEYLNLWSGPVYRDAEAEFLFLTEFDSCHGN